MPKREIRVQVCLLLIIHCFKISKIKGTLRFQEKFNRTALLLHTGGNRGIPNSIYMFLVRAQCTLLAKGAPTTAENEQLCAIHKTNPKLILKIENLNQSQMSTLKKESFTRRICYHHHHQPMLHYNGHLSYCFMKLLLLSFTTQTLTNPSRRG